MRYFERGDGRYYLISAPQLDLFGDNVVVTRRGSTYSRLGGCKTYFGADLAELNRVITQIVKVRTRHGYRELSEQEPAGN